MAVQTLKQLKPEMLCLADRGFLGYPLWQVASETGAQLLWRTTKNRQLPLLASLPDGSYLSEIYPSRETLKKMDNQQVKPLQVRVIEYRLPNVQDSEPVYRLITTLIDHESYPAIELAELYHERWRVETVFSELKTTLKGADVVMRSKTPALVAQEFWGAYIGSLCCAKNDA